MSDYNLENLDHRQETGNLSRGETLDFDNQLKGHDRKFGLSDDSYNVFMHLSQYLCYFLPFLGIIAPLFLWLRVKDDDPIADQHGRAILNWNFTLFIIYAVCIVCFLILIGIILIWIPIILSIIFPVIGAVKANDGIAWKYPLSFKFL